MSLERGAAAPRARGVACATRVSLDPGSPAFRSLRSATHQRCALALTASRKTRVTTSRARKLCVR